MVEKTWVISAFHKAISTAMVRNTETTDVPVTALVGALELLKEQEPVEPDKPEEVWLCGNCGEIVGWDDWIISTDDVRHKYCPGCGRKVKWDD